ncbi:uncharacterized protein C9orf43 homolog isoform X5 [Neovison vison]|uniref:uncharacterized protein C9orf43 homolog isoform X5 n=1 Tax=Neovison vison TaxID=452646 RepID=UPI001CF06BB0|nr:uncharacterized protein C9orf43 homolog isoform X5 [Neogale vison]
MDLPEESQWDETTCQLAVCQHPQCWATIRRIERGHPRILGPPCKTALNDEDKLPVLTTVNMADSCLWAKRRAHHHLSGFTFTRPSALLCPGAKFDSKLQGSPAEKKPVLRSQDWMKRRMISTMKDSWLSRKQKIETQLGPPGMIVPPPSPIQFLEQQSVPLWNQFDMLPQDLLKDLLPNEGKTMPSLEMRTQLAMMKKKAPLEKSRPDNAISSKMFLTVHRLTLQRPALRYPKHSKKLYHNLNTEGQKKQQQWQQKQQQRKVKTPPKRQEAKKKSKSDLGSQDILHKHSGTVVYGPCYGHRTLPSQESDKKQPQQTKSEEPTLRKDSTKRPQMEYLKNHLDSFPSKDDPELSKTEPSNKDISAQEWVVLGSQDRSSEDLLDDTSRRWNPELKLLRILQATENEDEEDQLSESQSEESF